MKRRLRFWLTACDVVERLRLPRRAWLWCLRRASDATDWRDENDQQAWCDEQAWRDAGCPRGDRW